MKKTITFVTICLLLFAGIHHGMAQTKEQTISKLRKLLEKYEIKELTPCAVHIIYKSDDDFYTEYRFAPHEAIWEGRDIGVFANWIVVNERFVLGEKEQTELKYIVQMHNNDKPFHDEVAKLLNHLATFCEEPYHIDKDAVTDTDLARYYYDLLGYLKVVKPINDEFEEKLKGYSTSLAQLKQNYDQIAYGVSLNDFTIQEQENYKLTKVIIQQYNARLEEAKVAFFNKTYPSFLPRFQFEAITTMVNNEPSVLERLKTVISQLNN
ncbi:hypothetical protein ACG2LH_18110 [Zhouia sp. PK063]|uniref:hypothetical protein n=1 Tax=Zhouia sp. PK063 TaxID=3373602 RepID=UPI0037ADB09C